MEMATRDDTPPKIPHAPALQMAEGVGPLHVAVVRDGAATAGAPRCLTQPSLVRLRIATVGFDAAGITTVAARSLGLADAPEGRSGARRPS